MSSYLRLENSRNVVYTVVRNDSNETMDVLLVPQFDVDVGLLHFAIGPNAYNRIHYNTLPVDVMAKEGPVMGLIPDAVRDAYEKVKDFALQFGFGTAEPCGGSTSKAIMNESVAVFVSIILASLISVCVIVLTTRLLDAKGGTREARRINTNRQNNSELDNTCTGNSGSTGGWTGASRVIMGGKSLICLFVFITTKAALFSVSVILQYILLSSTLKCGKPFCSAYEEAMGDLFDSLPTNEFSASCKVGLSFRVLFFGYICSGMSFLMVTVLAIMHYFTSESRQTRFLVPRMEYVRNPCKKPSTGRSPQRGS
ncbi:hypothetical protein ERJ75_000965000 [Trypanosoma vivax]|nr:hypothetical protein ERJ75_000965000 [Trypanosoma vivax]